MSRRGGKSRGRRTPGPAARSSGLPPAPFIALAVVVVVGALLAFLIWQQTKTASHSTEGSDIEQDPAPELPGEWVDLQTIYNAAYGENPNTASHVTPNDVDYVADGNTNPPAGGPHWAGGCDRDPTTSGPCGPALWGIYRDPWPPETLIHNMEHGGAIVWYNTTDQAIISDLEDLIERRLDRGDVVVLTPYPDMEQEYIAVTTWARIDKFPVEEYTRDRVDEYLDAHICRFNPEDLRDC